MSEVYAVCAREWDGISTYIFKVVEVYQDENEAIDICSSLNRSHKNPEISFFYEKADFVKYSHTIDI